MIASLALISAAAAPALWLSFPTDAAKAAPCRAGQFVAALNELRPALEIRLGAAANPNDATAAIALGDDGWTLQVVREGKPPLHRALPAPQGDCLETASTAALMIDRALDDLRWSGEPVRIEPLAQPGEPVEATRVEVGAGAPDKINTIKDTTSVDTQNIGTASKVVDASTITTRSESAAPASEALQLGLGEATVFGSLEPSLSLEFSWRRGPWSLGLSLAGALPFAGPVGGDDKIGTLSGFESSLQSELGRAFALGPGSIRVEGGLGVELARASASGPLLEQQDPGFALGIFALARIGYELPLGDQFALGLRLQGQLFLRPIDFAVEGYSGGLSSSRGAATLSLFVSRNFF